MVAHSPILQIGPVKFVLILGLRPRLGAPILAIEDMRTKNTRSGMEMS